MSDLEPAVRRDAAANRELWTRVNGEYADEHAFRAWAAEDITWGVFNVPESQLSVLGDVSGLDVVELGCGTAYFSAWLGRGCVGGGRHHLGRLQRAREPAQCPRGRFRPGCG